MRFHVTQNVRQFDAGIIELGLVYSDRMAIPPGMENFNLDGYCLPECTATVSKDMK
jgi:dopamine beta-monooxygenase